MSVPLLVVRPEPGCCETLAAARALGLTAVGTPLFEIRPVAWTPPDPARFDALIAGSANAFRHGGQQLAGLSGLPVLAVGERTAQEAQVAGFRVEAVGKGGLQQLLDSHAGPGRYLRLAGEARVDLSPPEEVTVEDRVVYRAAPLPLSHGATEHIRGGAVVLLHSAEAARRLASECDRLAIERSRISLAALAPRVAEAAGEGWEAVAVAADVTDAALLAMASDMCH